MLPAVVVLAGMLFLAPSAFAGVGGSVVPQLASPGVVNAAADLPGSLTITNQNTAPQNNDSDEITQIAFVPACRISLVLNACVSFSPGSIVLNPGSAVGRAGTACDGVTFALSTPDPDTGVVTLTPSSTVTLAPGSANACVIDFTYKVLGLPTNDASPPVPDQYQTHQYGSVNLLDVTAGLPGTATGTAFVIIRDAPPTCNIPAHGGSPGSVSVTTQESDSGISTVTFTTINATVGVSPAATLTSGDTSNGTYTYSPPETGLVTVTATRTVTGIDSRLDMTITDAAGRTNTVNCDPIAATATAGGIAKKHTLKKLGRDMRFLSVANGTPGLRKINIGVNGRLFKVLTLADGKRAKLNLGKALTRKSNTVTISGRGKSKATAEIMIANVK